MTLSMAEQKTVFSVAETVKKYGKQLMGFIRGKVGTVEDAEDILQDVWYQLSKVAGFEELESVSGWLYFVARNKIIDSYRKIKSSSLEDMTFENEEGEFSIKEILLLDDNNDPELKLFKNLFWKEMFTALDELPENQKQVFILNEIEHKTLQEIADTEGMNIKTIISRKGYAVKHLRKKLDYLYREIYQ
ncbi:MAG: sigma-70 family RNA polymerase sigma factor [Chitinophagaceae bacterium]|nr:sigma-70 family RNA polymerase sigma factor [Chitinophagaceae bacterium]